MHTCVRKYKSTCRHMYMYTNTHTQTYLASTIFQAFSISFLRAAMVPWSSSLSLRAVCTLAALATISAFSSRHFLCRRTSLSAHVRGLSGAQAHQVCVSANVGMLACVCVCLDAHI